jgi:DNA-binding transcriptional ArsR family regulator
MSDLRRKTERRELASSDSTHEPAREMSPALLCALHHPVRRQVLRALHEETSPLSASAMSRSRISVGLPRLSFHARVLCEMGVIECVATRDTRGSTERLYASLVAENELVGTILRNTAADDARLRK